MTAARLAVAFACAVAVAPPVSSQQGTSELRVRLNARDGTPVNGALVALLDARDSVVAEGLSAGSGLRALRATAGTYRVRVRRIGYRPFFSQSVSVPRAGDLVLDVESSRVMLEDIVINSRSECRPSDPDARSLATVWDEIDKALSASQLTMADLEGIGWARTYRKETAPGGAIISADSAEFPISDRRPFGAISSAMLAKDGYVVGDQQTGWTYYAPDEVVLLSEQFAATHCFQLVRESAHPRQIGVSFEPTRQRKLPDIRGVLWVDEATSELRDIVFDFVNVGELDRFDAGGFTRFRRLPSGTWIVDEWSLSMPRLELRVRPGFRQQLVAVGRLEHGGGVLANGLSQPSAPAGLATARAPSPANAAQDDSTTELTVTVVNSDRQPIPDATVFIEGTSAMARTDSLGTAILHPRATQATVHARYTGIGERAVVVTLGVARKQRLLISLTQ
ncbi:MAG TPA: carboxypeptidase-like regulatory domain-containing protein [Gemmatimonadaceae bacterium]